MDPSAEAYRRFLSGDAGAIAEIIETHRAGLQMYLYSLTRDMALAEDLTQDTFLRIFVKRPRFRPDANFKTWLYTIGANLAFNAIKRQKREQPTDGEALADAGGGAEDPAAVFLASEERRRLHAALLRLPPTYRQILQLTYFDDLSGREAAAVMGIKPHYADVLRARAKSALKRELCKEGFTDEIE